MKKIEFHVHTRFSNDSILNGFLILLMCKLKKINCIAITDHNEIKGALKYQRIFKKYNIDVIVGEEIFSNDGEIIGLFLNNKIEPNLSAKETVKLIKEQGGFVYIPHPYDKKRRKTVIKEDALLAIKSDIDFIECHNGRNVEQGFTLEQNKIAEKLNLRKIVGSDSHTFYELGRNYCLVENYDKDQLLENIENSIFVTKKCIRFAHTNTKVSKIIDLVAKGDFYGIIRIIRKKIKRRK